MQRNSVSQGKRGSPANRTLGSDDDTFLDEFLAEAAGNHYEFTMDFFAAGRCLLRRC